MCVLRDVSLVFCFYSLLYDMNEFNLWDISLGIIKLKGVLLQVVEIGKGSKVKYELDKTTGLIKVTSLQKLSSSSFLLLKTVL